MSEEKRLLQVALFNAILFAPLLLVENINRNFEGLLVILIVAVNVNFLTKTW